MVWGLACLYFVLNFVSKQRLFKEASDSSE